MRAIKCFEEFNELSDQRKWELFKAAQAVVVYSGRYFKPTKRLCRTDQWMRKRNWVLKSIDAYREVQP